MTRLDQLKAKLRARQGKPGFEDNVKALQAEIAREEAREAARQEEPGDD